MNELTEQQNVTLAHLTKCYIEAKDECDAGFFREKIAEILPVSASGGPGINFHTYQSVVREVHGLFVAKRCTMCVLLDAKYNEISEWYDTIKYHQDNVFQATTGSMTKMLIIDV